MKSEELGLCAFEWMINACIYFLHSIMVCINTNAIRPPMVHPSYSIHNRLLLICHHGACGVFEWSYHLGTDAEELFVMILEFSHALGMQLVWQEPLWTVCAWNKAQRHRSHSAERWCHMRGAELMANQGGVLSPGPPTVLADRRRRPSLDGYELYVGSLACLQPFCACYRVHHVRCTAFGVALFWHSWLACRFEAVTQTCVNGGILIANL